MRGHYCVELMLRKSELEFQAIKKVVDAYTPYGAAAQVVGDAEKKYPQSEGWRGHEQYFVMEFSSEGPIPVLPKAVALGIAA